LGHLERGRTEKWGCARGDHAVIRQSGLREAARGGGWGAFFVGNRLHLHFEMKIENLYVSRKSL